MVWRLKHHPPIRVRTGKSLEPITTQLCVESGTNKSDVPTTDPKIAMPQALQLAFCAIGQPLGWQQLPNVSLANALRE